MLGKMYISSDFNEMSNFIANGATVLAFVDEAEKYRYINCIIMGVLLPPYESLSAEIDGDANTAAVIYYSYLMSKINIIANILAALNMGKHILIFVPAEESMNFGFVNVLLKFFLDVFGIKICTGSGDSYEISNDPVYVSRRADALFVNDLIPFENYCMMMPPQYIPSEAACGKIMQSINYTFNSMQECIIYCGQYIHAIQEQKRGVFSPVFRVKT
jgi:hypothetical protein